MTRVRLAEYVRSLSVIVLVPSVLLGVSATAAAATDGAASTAGPMDASLPVGALIWIVLGLGGVIAGLTATRRSRRAAAPVAAPHAAPVAAAPRSAAVLATAGSI